MSAKAGWDLRKFWLLFQVYLDCLIATIYNRWKKKLPIYFIPRGIFISVLNATFEYKFGWRKSIIQLHPDIFSIQIPSRLRTNSSFQCW